MTKSPKYDDISSLPGHSKYRGYDCKGVQGIGIEISRLATYRGYVCIIGPVYYCSMDRTCNGQTNYNYVFGLFLLLLTGTG